jgi:superfamily II DNA or RNA helicase
MKLFTAPPQFIWSANAEGLAVRFGSARGFQKAREGRGSEAEQVGFIRMQMLAESGQAEVREVEAGIFIAAADAVRLDVETREGFLLPPAWPGGLRLQTGSVPQLEGFSARLGLVDPGADAVWQWKLRGPILETTGESYLPTAAQYAALRAFSDWKESPVRNELANLSLLATLRETREAGCHIELEAYRDTIIASAQELSIDARREERSGDLILRPVVAGEFPALNVDEVEQRLAQLAGEQPRAVLRVGKTIILLNPTQTAQARALRARGRVPKSDVAAFEQNPSAWLAERVFPDVGAEFSPRVTGIGAWRGGYLGAAWEQGEDWFGKQPAPEKKPQHEAGKEGGEGASGDGEPDEKPAEEKPAQLVPLIIPNDAEIGFGWRFAELQSRSEQPFAPDFGRYARAPMPHQEEAVRWLLGHARRALHRRESETRSGYGAGALLADDMGLGKTFSTLVFLAEWLDLWRNMTGTEPPGVLIVAPLSLLENWKDEIVKSFRGGHAVFTRVLLAQPDGDLHQVRRSPGSRDAAVPGEVTQYGLSFGDGSERSVDMPGGCVLTTYQTLRDYRFSFAKAEWSAAIFDEAQNIKNPNALQTIAAKALKALFRVTLTGTPVENHLGDFWSILDAAEPRPLGSFAEFRRDWIARMSRERERAEEIGRELRERVGGLMLRRLKEEQLTGLPRKAVESIAVPLTREQVAQYDAAVAAVRSGEAAEGEGGPSQQNCQLAALWQLRQISLHPDLLGGGTIARAKSSSESRAVLERSGKLAWLLQQLDAIKAGGEKALVFCVQKKLQEALAHHLGQIYGVSVPVINGDTEATSLRRPDATRLGLIKQWSGRPGFSVCVLSPIAAGAGLNIVAANHVIHLERHWNPAKEDQATDRAYRIGQTRPVTVYLPISQHPALESFDSVLHRLLQKKRGIQSALGLVPPEAVSAPELMSAVFGNAGAETTGDKPLDLAAALRLAKSSWRLFEALVAVIYERESQQVILTPGGSDHGCDVVVLGWGAQRENVLIQCKSTSREELDSEVAVREVEGARPYYENALNVRFARRSLHTTAQSFSRRTQRGGELCGVTLHGRKWIADALRSRALSLDAILRRDGLRERV